RKKRGSPGWERVSVSGPMASPLSRHDEASGASASNDGSGSADPSILHGQCFGADFSAAGFAAAGSAFAALSALAVLSAAEGAIDNGDTPSGGTTTDGNTLLSTSTTAGVR